MTDMVRVKLENGAEASVPAEFADVHSLDIIMDKGAPVPAYGPNGQLLGPTYPERVEEAAADAAKLKGKALDEALTEAGLSTSGTLADRQGRLAEHQAAVAAQAQLAGASGTPAATPAGTPPVGDN